MPEILKYKGYENYWLVNQQTGFCYIRRWAFKAGDGPPGGLQTVSREALRREVQTYSISYEKEITQKSLNVCKVQIGRSFSVFWGDV